GPAACPIPAVAGGLGGSLLRNVKSPRFSNSCRLLCRTSRPLRLDCRATNTVRSSERCAYGPLCPRGRPAAAIGQNLAAALTILAGGLLQQSGKTLRQPSLFSRAACCSTRAKPCASGYYSRGRPAAALVQNLAPAHPKRTC